MRRTTRDGCCDYQKLPASCVQIGLILKCNEMSEKTIAFKSCTR